MAKRPGPGARTPGPTHGRGTISVTESDSGSACHSAASQPEGSGSEYESESAWQPRLRPAGGGSGAEQSQHGDTGIAIIIPSLRLAPQPGNRKLPSPNRTREYYAKSHKKELEKDFFDLNLFFQSLAGHASDLTRSRPSHSGWHAGRILS